MQNTSVKLGAIILVNMVTVYQIKNLVSSSQTVPALIRIHWSGIAACISCRRGAYRSWFNSSLIRCKRQSGITSSHVNTNKACSSNTIYWGWWSMGDIGMSRELVFVATAGAFAVGTMAASSSASTTSGKTMGSPTAGATEWCLLWV
jgi:hypothetical protein